MIGTGEYRAACGRYLADLQEQPELAERLQARGNPLADYGIDDGEAEEFLDRVASFNRHVRELIEERRASGIRAASEAEALRDLEAHGADMSLLDTEARGRVGAELARGLGDSSSCSACLLGVRVGLAVFGGVSAIAASVAGVEVMAIAGILAAVVGVAAPVLGPIVVLMLGGILAGVSAGSIIAAPMAMTIAAAVVNDLPQKLCESLNKCSPSEPPLDPSIAQWEGLAPVMTAKGGLLPPAGGDLSAVALNSRMFVAYPGKDDSVHFGWTFKDVFIDHQPISISGASGQGPMKTGHQNVTLCAHGSDLLVVAAKPDPDKDQPLQLAKISVPSMTEEAWSKKIENDSWAPPINWTGLPLGALPPSHDNHGFQPRGRIGMAVHNNATFIAFANALDDSSITVWRTNSQTFDEHTTWQDVSYSGAGLKGDAHAGGVTLFSACGFLWMFFASHNDKHCRVNYARWASGRWIDHRRFSASGHKRYSSRAVGAVQDFNFDSLLGFMRGWRSDNLYYMRWYEETGLWTVGTLALKPPQSPPKGVKFLLTPQTSYGPAALAVREPEIDDPQGSSPTDRLAVIYAEKNPNRASTPEGGSIPADTPFWSLK